MIRPASLLTIGVLALGCYGKPPPARSPVRDVPGLVEGQPMVVHSEETSDTKLVNRQDCVSDDRNRRACGETYKVAQTYHGTRKTVTYGDQLLTRGQIVALATPDLDARAAEYDRTRARCKKFRAPQVAAGIMILGGILFYPFGSSLVEDRNTRIAIGAGAVGAGILTYAIGYLAGGSVCNESARLYDRYFVAPRETEQYGEILDIVKEFNARLAAPAGAPAAE